MQSESSARFYHCASWPSTPNLHTCQQLVVSELEQSSLTWGVAAVYNRVRCLCGDLQDGELISLLHSSGFPENVAITAIPMSPTFFPQTIRPSPNVPAPVTPAPGSPSNNGTSPPPPAPPLTPRPPPWGGATGWRVPAPSSSPEKYSLTSQVVQPLHFLSVFDDQVKHASAIQERRIFSRHGCLL